MLNEGYNFEKLFFSCFQVENKVRSMYKISCLHPIGLKAHPLPYKGVNLGFTTKLDIGKGKGKSLQHPRSRGERGWERGGAGG
jgi:hypothetical protein